MNNWEFIHFQLYQILIMNLNKMKNIKWKQVLKFSALILFLLMLFSNGLKVKVIGLLQRGILELGIVNPKIESKKVISVNEKTYQLTLENQNGKIVKLSELKNKVVFINFWATWCPPCVAEMPSIQQLYENYKYNNEVVFLLINQDENFNKAKNFVKKKNYNFTIYQAKSKIPKDLKSFGIPTTYVLDKQGNIAFEHSGMANYNSEKFISFIEKLKEE